MPTIDRCVCQNIRFAEILPRARDAGWDLQQLVEATSCGARCGLCRPYLRRMLETGETVFSAVIVE